MKCENCQGSGEVECYSKDPEDPIFVAETCVHCNGTGETDVQCSFCNDTATRTRCSKCRSDTEHEECDEDIPLCEKCFKEDLEL